MAVQRRSVPRIGALLALTKQRQSLLLLVTGVGAYALSLPGAIDWPRLLLGSTSLWLAVSGCTALNMVLDRDIDAKMARTARRPLPTGEIPVGVATALGIALSAPGLLLAWALGPTFGAVVTAGFLIDFVVYTAWLKRRTSFSILIGGLSGGMPALAGRALAVGSIDVVGVLLAAGVPVWPSVYGPTATRRLIASSSVLGALTLVAAGVLIGVHQGALAVLTVLGAALCALAVGGLIRPSDKHDWLLFKAASVYMAASFGCLVAGAAFAA
jgi:protoheme IX farnesyltransferase